MDIQLKVLFILALTGVKCQTVFKGSEVTKKETNSNSDSHRRYDADRFNKDFDDDEWHVAHLKYAKMDGRRDCAGDTFKEKARRYRKTLQNDGSLVKFVSSDPLPFNASELQEDSCKDILEEPKIEKKHHNKVNETTKHTVAPAVTDAQTANDAKALPVIQNVSDTTSPVSKKESYQATTPTIKVTVEDDRSKEEEDDGEKEKILKSRRGTEYMFSSVEYYDEIPDFDPTTCPDAVDVIELEIDELRSYDVECEKLIEWRSLNE